MSLRSELRRICPGASGKNFQAHVMYLLRFWKYIVQARLENVVALSPAPDTVAIIASYKRPQNIDALLSILLRVPSISSVVVSNNNASIDLCGYMSTRSPKVTLLQSPINRPCQYRQEVARMFPAVQYLIIDDDLFLMPSAIEKLLQYLRTDPSRVHGYFGELRDTWIGETHHGIHGYTFSMENLNRVYACTRNHIETFVDVSTALRFTPSSPHWTLSMWDDIVLSYSGTRKPKIHSLETPFLNCITSDDSRVAAFKQPEFHALRDQLRRTLEKVRPLPV